MREAIDHFENFFSEVFLELAQFGEIEEMHVCDNIGDHLIGNTYVKFISEDDAEKVKKNISGRYYAGKLIIPEYSPVTGGAHQTSARAVAASSKRASACAAASATSCT